MSISSAPFQFFTCVCPYPAHTGLDIDVELQAFVFPVTLIKWLLLLEIPKWQHRLVITTQDSKPVQRKTTFSDGIHLHFKVLLSQMGLCHPLLPHLFHSGFVWFLVINIKKKKKKAGFFFLHRRQEFQAFRSTVKHRSYWVELHSSFLAKARPDIVFVSFVPRIISVVPVFKHESDPWEKLKVILSVGFGFVFFYLSFRILKFKFLVLSVVSGG